MGTTSLGITYPESGDHTRLWEHFETMAEDVNGLIDTTQQEFEGAWTSYTPVWSATAGAPAVGNGSITGAYKRVGNIVHVRVVLVLGSTSTIGSGAYRISLPVAAKVGSLLSGLFKDASNGSARYSGMVEITAATTGGDNMRIAATNSTGVVGSAAPVVPANSDELLISGTYEAA